MNGWMLFDTQKINDASPYFKDILYVANIIGIKYWYMHVYQALGKINL